MDSADFSFPRSGGGRLSGDVYSNAVSGIAGYGCRGVAFAAAACELRLGQEGCDSWAGIAGLVSAYELRKAGFECTVLEARERPGGRSWTVRNGSKVEFTDGTVQTCDWEGDSYLNPGPARLPSIHKNILGYCEELGVPLEVEINTSRSTLMQSKDLNGGKPVEQRQVVNDTRGYISELLAKCIDQHGLDQVLSKDDTQRMLAFLQTYGDLGRDYKYTGSERSGVDIGPGAGPDEEKLRPPLKLHELLVADFSMGELYEEQLDWQATMFQPVGGMDRIPYAFAKSLGPIVRYGSPVQQLRKTDKGVRVVYTDGASHTPQTIEADYCICTLPITILDKLDTDFSAEKKQAFKGMKVASLYKIGWEAPRFWEKQYNIYGGISFTRQMVEIWSGIQVQSSSATRASFFPASASRKMTSETARLRRSAR